MSKLKISELFYSLQGEGRYMGVPSIFLRTFGCNFTCGGFGMPRGEISVERDKIPAETFKDYKSLPLVTTGCDSYASWDPSFKHLSPVISSSSIVSSIMSLLPHGAWKSEHLVITGGEPLLGWQRAYPDLLQHAQMKPLREITFETNGTQKLTPEFKTYLRDWGTGVDEHGFGYPREVTFSVSPKLPCSGEWWEDAILPEVVCEYEEVGTVYLKFVIATEQDFEDAERAIAVYRAKGFTGHVYLMPVGGTSASYFMNNKTVAKLAADNGLRYSARLQVDLYKNEWGT